MQENQEGAQNLLISDTELKQVVYAFRCNKSTLQVKGKLNSITLGENRRRIQPWSRASAGRVEAAGSAWRVCSLVLLSRKHTHTRTHCHHPV